MQNTTMIRRLFSAATAAGLLAVAGGAHAQTYGEAVVRGELAPGVYGRIQIGNAPPPPVIYAQPVIIRPPAVVVPRAPIYLYVPPGHAKNWGKHCARYNACSQPVYFVQEPPPRRGSPYQPPRARDDRRWDDNHRHGGGQHDRGHARGQGRGDDRGDHRGDGRGDGRGKGHGDRD